MQCNFLVLSFQVLVPLFGNSPLFRTISFKLCLMVYFLNFAKSVGVHIFLEVEVVFMSKLNDW